MVQLVHVKTKTGLEIDVDQMAVDDAELLDALYDLQTTGNALAIVKVARQLLTPEAKQALFDHVRNDAGRVPIESLSDELTDIMEALNGKKK